MSFLSALMVVAAGHLAVSCLVAWLADKGEQGQGGPEL